MEYSFSPFKYDFCVLLAYEILSDEKRRQEYDQMGHSPFFSEATGGWRGGGGGRAGQHFHHTFDFDDMFRDFDLYAQNRDAHHRRQFEDSLRAQQQGQGRHKRHFQGGFGAGLFDDMFDDMEKMFTIDRESKRTESRFQGTTKQQCRTVTQRRGNMVTTYTDCTGSW